MLELAFNAFLPALFRAALTSVRIRFCTAACVADVHEVLTAALAAVAGVRVRTSAAVRAAAKPAIGRDMKGSLGA